MDAQFPDDLRRPATNRFQARRDRTDEDSRIRLVQCLQQSFERRIGFYPCEAGFVGLEELRETVRLGAVNAGLERPKFLEVVVYSRMLLAKRKIPRAGVTGEQHV